MSVSKKRLNHKDSVELYKKNAISASIILNDIEKHGGEKSMQVQWARLWCSNNLWKKNQEDSNEASKRG